MLTKSDFTKFLQCRKYLWLYKNRQDLLPPELDRQLERRFEEGFEVEEYAYELFPGGTQAGDESIPVALKKTKLAIESGARVIYQPTFSDSRTGLFCRADILRRTEGGSYELYEVKSATEVKEIHIADVAFQKVCLEDLGLRVERVHLVLVNNQYVRKGTIEPKKLLKVVDVSDEVAGLKDTLGDAVFEALKTLQLKSEPDVRILKQCKNPYECPFIEYCWKDIPVPSIYDLRLSESKLNALLDEGIIQLKDVPEEMVPKSKKKFYEAVKSGAPIVDRAGLGEWLKGLKYPFYFLDYETYDSAIPLFDGYRPYEKIPFQYSLHILDAPGAMVRHFEHLEEELVDPVPALAKTLKEQIGPTGTVLAWNMSFEKGRNTDMARHLPAYAKFFKSVNERMIDMMKPISSGLYVHPDFGGLSSIKIVLPVMAPELSYEEMRDDETGFAFNDWPILVGLEGGPLSADERETLVKRMLDYCKLDTYGMVRILEELKNIEGNGP